MAPPRLLARRRRHRQGAVMVEAIVVIITLTLFLVGLIFSQRYYSLRLRSLRSARTVGAALALHGCDRGMTAADALDAADLQGLAPGSESTSSLNDLVPTTDSGNEDANASLQDAASRTMPLQPKAVTVRYQGSTTVQDGAGSGFTGEAKSTTYLLCNDEPKDGSVVDILPIIRKFSFLVLEVTTMQRRTRNPFRWLVTRRWSHLIATARVSAYLTCICLLGAALSARAAWGAIGDGSLAVGRQMDALRDVLGSTKTLAFNGQPMNVSTAVVHAEIGTVLDRFQAECGQNLGGLSRLLGEFDDPHAVAINRVLRGGRAPFGVLRVDDVNDGMVLCLLDYRYKEVSAVTLLEEFSKTRDLSLFGDMMYVFAKKIDDERTHVITTWTSGPFRALDLFPATGDAPGSDSDLIARPVASRRILSGIAADAPYGVRIYESDEPVETLFASFDQEMAARGWEKAAAPAIQAGGRVFFHPSGAIAEAFATKSTRKTIFSTVEMGRADFAKRPEKRD
jgi:hypothetical protein